MSSLLILQHWVRGIEHESMVNLLVDFRRRLERENDGKPLYAAETNAAYFLYDLSNYLGLDPEQRAQVLGKSAAHVEATLEQCYKLPSKH